MEACNACYLSIRDVAVMCEDNEAIRVFLIQHGVISNSVTCPTCGSKLPLNWDRKDYRCQKYYLQNKNKKKCSFQRTVFKDTFFSKSHLALDKILMFVSYFVTLAPPRQNIIASELALGTNTIADWMSFAREVCTYYKDQTHTMIGGPNEEVEIDEVKIGKRKYNRRRIIEGQCVFGGVQRSDPTKKFFVVTVSDRTRETLVGIINENILPGTKIFSDCWKTYDCLDDLGFPYQTVNHSCNFVDPDSGAHTQNVERMWRELRAKVPCFGRQSGNYEAYLSEFIFKRGFPTLRERFHHFFRLAAELYPPSS